jgi:tetratricopeptide (TPR) repeat protein
MNTPWYKDHLKKIHPKVESLLGKDFNYEKACSLFAEKNNLFIYPYFTEYQNIFGNKCEVVPYGLINKVVVKNSDTDIATIKKYNDTIWQKYFNTINLNSYKNRSTRTQEALYYLAEQKNYTGTYYLLHQNPSWALKEFEESKKLSRYEANALISESVVFFNERKTNEAINALNEAEQRAPATIDIYKNRGLIYGKLGQEDNAYSDLKKYIEFKPIDPQSDAIKNFLQEYERKREQTTIY